MIHYQRRLNLETLFNCRDLGGYPVPGGRTKFGEFLRSEIPEHLSQNDINYLKEYGVNMVLEFCFPSEAERRPTSMHNLDFVDYRLMPILDGIVTQEQAQKYWMAVDTSGQGQFNWAYQYIQILEDSKPWMKRALEASVEKPGCVFFHCFTGKDRTGVFAAIVLGLAGVSKEDIAGDYSLSMALMEPFFDTHFPVFSREDREGNLNYDFLFTPPANMFIALQHIDKKYGTIENYVKSCGVSDETIAKIREKIIEKYED